MRLGVKKKRDMLTELIVKPSLWIEKEIQISQVKGLYLFKFTEELQARLDTLSEQEKQGQLNSEEEAELAGILELNQIFTLLNAKIIAQFFMIDSAIRQQVRARADYLCEYCHSSEDASAALFEIDHLIPRSLGGSDELDNLA